MKKLFATTCAATLIASGTYAGGMAEPIEMAPVEIIEDTAGSAGSSGGLIVPLIIIALIAAAVGSSDSGDSGNVGNASDIRLKDNITRVGTAANGLPLYHFTYRGSDIIFEGVMAQDVLSHTPEAVITGPSGLLAVNYDMIGVDFRIVD